MVGVAEQFDSVGNHAEGKAFLRSLPMEDIGQGERIAELNPVHRQLNGKYREKRECARQQEAEPLPEPA